MAIPWKPHNYQKKIIKFMVGQGAAGIFADPGLGKSSATYGAFKVLKAKKQVNSMLVIAPLRAAHSTWPNEAEKWEDFNDLKVVVLHGPEKAKLLLSDFDVAVINPEGLKWLFDTGVALPDMLVVDESTRFKHANTVRAKELKPHLKEFKRRYILTGTPAPNGLLDLFGQIYILDLGYSLGGFISHYRTNYFDQTGYGGYTWLPRKGAEEAIYQKLRPLVIRMAAEDYLELPELINNTVEVELPDKVMKVYRDMEDLMIAQLEESPVLMAANAAAATNKCRQIANGGAYYDVEGNRKSTHLHDAKLDAVEELVEELSGKPALVAYEFDHDRIRLQERFPDAPYIGGGVSAKDFQSIERRWNAGMIPVLLAQPQSVAHGLNLQGTGAAVIHHSITWDLETYEQFIRRVWRQGQKERVVNHHIVAKGTVDEVIMRLLLKKDKTQKALLNALKDHVKGRNK